VLALRERIGAYGSVADGSAAGSAEHRPAGGAHTS
jgi:hypothetical protein